MAGKKKATPKKKTAARGKPKSTTRGRATAASRTKGVRAKPSRAAKPARKPRPKPAAKPKVGPILDAKTAHAALEEQARSLAYVDLIRELDATGSKSETATWRDVLLTEIERRKKDEPKPAKVTRARAKDEEE